MKIESYKIVGWDNFETGILLDENADWILIKSVPENYQVDGYKFLNKNHIESRFEAENSDLTRKVLELKGIEIIKPNILKLTDTIEILQSIEEKYGCFEFQDDVEDELFYGVLGDFNKESFSIDFIKSDGTIDYEFDEVFEVNEVRTITFDSDYFNSIRLLYNYFKEHKK
ncbi:hypothetical protein [Tenacibaculum geojense]|uniref:Uncharacterized protein n=1 Tax=Tenacibaculum geojense TaxID=915352 RepID=A0ABW3JS36_9FLAO